MFQFSKAEFLVNNNSIIGFFGTLFEKKVKTQTRFQRHSLQIHLVEQVSRLVVGVEVELECEYVVVSVVVVEWWWSRVMRERRQFWQCRGVGSE